MTPDEVLDKLVKMGVKTSRSTLLRFEKANLIPIPKRGATGRGGGRYSDYPDDTPEQFFASWWLIKSEGISVDELSELLIAKRKYYSGIYQETISGNYYPLHKQIIESRNNITSDSKETKSDDLYKLWLNYCCLAKKNIITMMEDIIMYKKMIQMQKECIKQQQELIEESVLEMNRLKGKNKSLKVELKRLNKLLNINPV